MYITNLKLSNVTINPSLNSLFEEIKRAQNLIHVLTIELETTYDDGTSAALESMTKKEKKLIKQAVDEVHKYKISNSVKQKNGKPYKYYRTVIDTEGHSMTSSNLDDLYEKLFIHYFGSLDALKSHTYQDITLTELYELWKNYRLTDLQKRAKTIVRTEQDYNKYLKDLPLMQKKVREITSKDLKNTFKRLAPQMKQKAFSNTKSILNGMFAYAVEELEIIPYDICTPIRVSRNNGFEFVPTKSHLTEVYTKSEREAILSYLENLDHQTGYTWAIRLMFCLDCRIGELKALKWAHYYPDKFDHPMILISNQVVYDLDVNGKHAVKELDHTKAKDKKGERLNLVSPRAKRVLDEIQEAGVKSDYILCTEVGTPIHTDKFNRILKKTCQELGIDYHSSHRLRNYSITEQSKQTDDLLQIAQNSGQLNLETTLGYVRKAKNEMQDYEAWCEIHN